MEKFFGGGLNYASLMSTRSESLKIVKLFPRNWGLAWLIAFVQPLLDLRIGGSPRSSLPELGQPPADLSQLKGKHFATGPKKGGKRGRCIVCGSKKTNEGKRKDTKTVNKCVQCDVFLCEGVCFTDYRTKVQMQCVTISLLFPTIGMQMTLLGFIKIYVS